MIISFVVAVYFQFLHVRLGFPALHPSVMLIAGVAITTVGWLIVIMLTPSTDRETLQAVYDKIRPFSRGWRSGVATTPGVGEGSLAAGLSSWFLGCVAVYAALFGTGFLLYGNTGWGVFCTALAGAAAYGLFKTLPGVGTQ